MILIQFKILVPMIKNKLIALKLKKKYFYGICVLIF